MRKMTAILFMIFMLLQAASAENVVYSADDGGSLYLGVAGDNLIIFQRKFENDKAVNSCGIVSDLTQSLEAMEYAYDADRVYQYFPAGQGTKAYAYTEDGLIVSDVTVGGDGTVSHADSAACDTSDFDSFYPSMPTVCGDYFICSSMTDNGMYALYALNTVTGDMREIDQNEDNELIYVVSICEYDADSVLVAAQRDFFDGEVKLYLYNPESGSLKYKSTVLESDGAQFGALAYCSETDTIYYMLNNQLCAMTAFDMYNAVQLPDMDDARIDFFYSQALVTRDGLYYVLCDGADVYAASTDPNSTGTGVKLKIWCGGSDYEDVYNTIDEFKSTDGLRAKCIYERPEGSSLDNDIITQSGAIDLYVVRTNSIEYASLIEHGYLTPIDSTALQEFAESMYPNMRDAITVDGQVIALPIFFSYDYMEYNPDALAALGVNDGKAPETWEEYIALLARMPETVADTGYSVFESSLVADRMRSTLTYKVLEAYFTNYMCGDELDEAYLIGLIDSIAQIDFHNMRLSESADNRLDDDLEHTVFFAYNYSSLDRDSHSSPMLLKQDKYLPAYLSGVIEVVIINPYSENRAAAVEFLECLLGNLNNTERAYMCADFEDGVKIDGADEYLQSAEDEIAMIQAELDSAKDEDEIAQYQLLLEDAEASLENIMTYFYWEITPENLESYRSLANDILIEKYSGVNLYEVMDTALKKYLGGSITAERMISDIKGKLNIAINEN